MNNKLYKLKKTKAKGLSSLKALTASKLSPKTRATLNPELLTLADKEIKPATRIQRKFRSLPSSNIRNPDLLTENQMRKQILYYFKVNLPRNEEYYGAEDEQDDYNNEFVLSLYDSLPYLHDLNRNWRPANGTRGPEWREQLANELTAKTNQTRLAYYLNNISYKFFDSLSNITFTRDEQVNILNRDDGIGDIYDPNIHYIASCDYLLNGSLGIFYRLLYWALMFYPKREAALQRYGNKPSNLTNYQYAIKNILSFISGKILKNFYIHLFSRDITKKNIDREKNPLFKKSSRSPEKNQAIKTIKNNKIMRRYTKKIRGNQV